MPPTPIRTVVPRLLFTPEDLVPSRAILQRAAIGLVLLLCIIAMLWLDRDGLRDTTDGHVSFVDVVYFSMITITTVGYGDIIPVSNRARLLDAFVVTPVRLIIWVLFLGTAYQLIFRQYVEGYRMSKWQSGLDGHLIVCGFGSTGMSAVRELLAKGMKADQVVVIDRQELAARHAVGQGVCALQADATQEAALTDAVIQRAKTLLVATGRDDTNVLVVLTARHLNPSLRILAVAQEHENLKVFRQAGAQTIFSPSIFGGYALAAAVDQPHLIEYLNDLLTCGGRVNLQERGISPDEVGKTAADLRPDVILRVYRGASVLSLMELQTGARLKEGDTLVLIKWEGEPVSAPQK